MAEIIIMPKLGFNMDEGQLVKWHRRVGETVKKVGLLHNRRRRRITPCRRSGVGGSFKKKQHRECRGARLW